MANRERGELRHVVDGVEYTLRLTVNVICDIEERSGKSFAELVMTKSMTGCRWLLWGGLQAHHAEQFKSPQDVGALLLHGPGGLKAIYELATELLARNEPPKEESEAPTDRADETARPPEAAMAAPSGSDSTSTLVNSG